MKAYSAIVKVNGKTVYIENQEYQTKADFVYDLRRNGYSVNPRMVKPSNVFDYIINRTNCDPWDWELKEVPQD